MRSASGPRRAEPRRTEPADEPTLAAMELLGQRWVLRIVWELEPGALGFLELRRRMGNCSSSMLSERLQQLQAARIVAKLPDKSYELTTPVGISLGRAMQSVWDWAREWGGPAGG